MVSDTAVPLFSLKDTAATPTLSLALAERVMVPLTVELLEGEVMLTKGGVVSEVVLTLTVTAPEVVERLPLSVALAVKV